MNENHQAGLAVAALTAAVLFVLIPAVFRVVAVAVVGLIRCGRWTFRRLAARKARRAEGTA